MKVLVLKLGLGLLLSLAFAPVAQAALTVTGENEWALQALDGDAENWMMNVAGDDCAAGSRLWVSANEFAQTPSLNTAQRDSALAIAQSLEKSVQEFCPADLADNH